ncbi:histidine kinase [Gloeothece citriformis PCC 7424]|uniref:histidine kinase n=1 Tax=Gloeothece citriformis (strain PCC 7424) TaxID=65393 RepID=B7KEN8_GLOC7|nr:hybrid sensor histidine kinase/response regulator [Gloeothece citriformis]ACK69063.1 histidine kinase [Gloeothece citriformis PCC 7424]
MFSSTVTLDHFIQPVHVCEPTTDLETILTIFQSKPEEVIAVVNEQGILMGTITGSRLLLYLPDLLNFHLPLSQCIKEYHNLLTPIISLSAKMSVGQLCLSLPEVAANESYLQSYGLVDEQGKFLGLLNNWSLLKFLLSHSSNRLSPSFRSHSSFLEQVLGEFFEQVPFPVLMSSGKGQVLYQNSTWFKQLGDYLPYDPTNPSFCPSFSLTPVVVNPYSSFKVSSSLEDNLPTLKEQAFRAVQLLSRQGHPNYLSVSAENTDLSPWQLPHSSQNLVGSTLSNSSSDRSWQFIKVPLSLESVHHSYSEPIWLVMGLDVTQQQQFCQELALKNADLIQLNRLKDEFFTCISHELKSPLTSVIGLSSLLKEQKLGELNERQVHYTELIYHSGRQLMTLVNDLLDLTRLETRQLKLKLLPVEIKSVCQKAYHSLEEKYKGKIEPPIPFTLEIDPGLKEIVADELRLQQMLFHLLDNAVQLSESDGEIGLKVNRWENWIAFTVWDTGIGIPQESQTLLFQQWQSQENLLREQLEGTGLGLILTQRLAKAHGGDISFISRKERGSQFTLLLPVSFAQKNLENSSPTALTQIYPLVLVVESIATTIEQLTDLLTRLGYRFVIARTGTEALEKARQLQPEMIFINPLLPLLSGWDVLKLLKSDPSTKQIKVIVTSSQSEQSHSQQVGADGFLSLPLDPLELEKVLNNSQNINRTSLNHLTILRLHPDLEQMDWMGSVIDSQFDLCLGKQLSQLNCRLLEADSLEQAEMIASVWEVNVVVLDGKSLKEPLSYLLALRQCENLAALPLVTLDTTITESANRLGGLSVFPCLLPNHENKIEQLLQVIQIAARAEE